MATQARQTGTVGLETSQEVRRILYGGDWAAALAVARSLGLNGPLQQLGDLVLLALDHDESHAAEFAARCSGALPIRGWDGDQELADAIDAARGIAAHETRPLNEFAVDLEQLADLIDGGSGSAGGRLDLKNGEVWPEFAFEDSFAQDEDDDDPDRWLHVWPMGSRRAYNDMLDFTGPAQARRCPRVWRGLCKGAARFAGSRTSSLTGRKTVRPGTRSPKTVAAVGPASGSLMRGTARQCEAAPRNPAERGRKPRPVRS